ncbi:GCR1-dependent translation factor 1 [Mycoemilia scoparia]|uniref:GCR1-dependent translation factor 1 n=1 Tax=Mycoemilia scoparia TaxID=417184 RepID=A0A9W7ZVD7_9FUNG|nr:GCR1-dependent translation factor 1 [Mycoemilia scoparia]
MDEMTITTTIRITETMAEYAPTIIGLGAGNTIGTTQITAAHGTGFGGGQLGDSLAASVLMTFVSEIGDKTFLIAAILAMQHPRTTVFLGTCAALWLMSILSAFLGHAAVNIISQVYVSMLAGVLFWIFGGKMLHEAYTMSDDEIYNELDEVTAELDEKKLSKQQRELEGGFDGDDRGSKDEKAVAVEKLDGYRDGGKDKPIKPRGLLESIRNLMGFLLSPIFVESFLLAFLAEWGDRSQLATIALGAAKNVWGVVVGTIFGHTVCTGAAVIGGRLLATKISVRKITFAGGILFIIFGLVYMYEAYLENVKYSENRHQHYNRSRNASQTFLNDSDDWDYAHNGSEQGDFVLKINTGHASNILSACFLPGTSSTCTVSCSADGTTQFIDLSQYLSGGSFSGASTPRSITIHDSRTFQCHTDMTLEVVPDREFSGLGHVFFDCSEDGTVNRYDSRISTWCSCNGIGECHKHTLLDLSSTSPNRSFADGRRSMGITSIDIDPAHPHHLAVACSDLTVRIYDQRYLIDPLSITHPTTLSTSIGYTNDSSRSSINNNSWKLSKTYSLAYTYIPEKFRTVDTPTLSKSKLNVSFCEAIEGMRPHVPSFISSSSKYNSATMQSPIVFESDKQEYFVGYTNDKIQSVSYNKPNRARIVSVRFDSNYGAGTQEVGPISDLLVNYSPGEIYLIRPSFSMTDGYEKSNTLVEEKPEATFDGGSSSNSSSNSNEDNVSGSSGETKPKILESLDMTKIKRTNYTTRIGNNTDIVRVFKGHINGETMISEANFFGLDSSFIVAGSDDGRFFIWEKSTGKIINAQTADKNVVNRVRPHPTELVLAVSGIDKTIKLSLPTNPSPIDEESIARAVTRNISINNIFTNFNESLRDDRANNRNSLSDDSSDDNENSEDDDQDNTNDGLQRALAFVGAIAAFNPHNFGFSSAFADFFSAGELSVCNRGLDIGKYSVFFERPK